MAASAGSATSTASAAARRRQVPPVAVMAPVCTCESAAAISRPQLAADGETASWTIETKAGDWQTRTNYDFLRWEDLIQRDLAAPIWGTVFHAMWIYWRLVFSGTLARSMVTTASGRWGP